MHMWNIQHRLIADEVPDHRPHTIGIQAGPNTTEISDERRRRRRRRPRTAASGDSAPLLLLHPRREPFEYDLLPIPKLIFIGGALTLAPLRRRLPARVDAAALAEALQIPPDHAGIVLDTLASVLPATDRDLDDAFRRFGKIVEIAKSELVEPRPLLFWPRRRS